MQKRRRQGRERNDAEQNEGGRGSDEFVKRVGGVDGRIGCDRAGRGQRAGNMRRRHAGKPGKILLAPGPFAGRDQDKRQQRAEENADARADEALLDRVTHQKDAAERQRDAADPDHPARAEAFLEANGPCGRRFGGRWRS